MSSVGTGLSRFGSIQFLVHVHDLLFLEILVISFISVVTEIYVIIEFSTRSQAMKNRKISKLLIIGGYGSFGGRLATLVADYGELTIFIGGRSLHKARRFAEKMAGPATVIPVTFDRDGDVVTQVAELAPDLIVDASGPWQAYGERPYRIAEAAIQIGAHYLDLADGTDFVCNITPLDTAARSKGVFVLTGASTCPVLTAAVARSLSTDMIDIESITGGIAPSPFAGMGKSVVQAIAGYAGKPVRRIRDGQHHQSHTFASTRKFTIAPPGKIPLAPMTFSLIDVPDLQLLRNLGKPVRNTWFGVSTSPPVYHALLRILTRAVKNGFIPTLRFIAGPMHFVMNHLAWGEHRGGMFVEVRGTDRHDRKLCRSWHLVADGDSGPTVPALAATAIIGRCIQGAAPEPGARTAMNDLEISDYLPMLNSLDIHTGTRSEKPDDGKPIFEQVLGEAFGELPMPIRELHGSSDRSVFSGTASIGRSAGVLARIIGWLAGFPAANDNIPVTVHIETQENGETWQRNFGGHTFSSEMSAGSGRLSGLMCERFGPSRFGMALVVEGDRLRYVSRRWTFMGVPMPKWMMPEGAMYETVRDGKFVFHVEITLPIIGHVVTYQGSLQNDDQSSSNS